MPTTFTGSTTIASHPVVLSGPGTPTFTGVVSVSSHPIVFSADAPPSTGSLAATSRVATALVGRASPPAFTGSVAVASHPVVLTAIVAPPASGSAAVARRSLAYAAGSASPPAFAGAFTAAVARRSLAAAAGASPPSFTGSASVSRSSACSASGSARGPSGVVDPFFVRVTVNMVKDQEVPVLIEANVADVGLAFQCLVVDRDGAPVDVGGSTTRTFSFQRPGTLDVLSGAGSLLTDGSDGLLVYRFGPGELDAAGTWRFQLTLGFGAGVKHSEIIKFKVRGNLPVGV